MSGTVSKILETIPIYDRLLSKSVAGSNIRIDGPGFKIIRAQIHKAHLVPRKNPNPNLPFTKPFTFITTSFTPRLASPLILTLTDAPTDRRHG